MGEFHVQQPPNKENHKSLQTHLREDCFQVQQYHFTTHENQYPRQHNNLRQNWNL